ncbi:hypothetical protein [Zunongwangia pacifica]|uniref:Uncharacterized protein n=1 Tax=Zunongwangia pacifica TaxID=2911062 RepID=A0A9X1ZQH4_9FLAO|nr:hypothetical protein [Zunongwangia pacifica]MCL6218139.1 hypothetical protein [Zunongwangia pacifica]
MRKILIPTDLSVNSLTLLKRALDDCEQKTNIVLVYGASLSSSITELLFYSKEDYLEELKTEAFNKVMAVIESKYEDIINSLTIDIFFGGTKNAFNNFIEGQKITHAYLPSDGRTMRCKRKNVFNIIPFLKESDIEIINVEYPTAMHVVANSTLATLLVS